MIFILLFLLLQSALPLALAGPAGDALTSLFDARNPHDPAHRCINIGSPNESVAGFEPERGLVRYIGHEPRRISLPTVPIQNTNFDRAFNTQRGARLISLLLRVDPRLTYNVTLGFAELNNKTCRVGARTMLATVRGERIKAIDVFKSVGCRKAFFSHVRNVKPCSRGMIHVSLEGVNNEARIAIICIARNGGPRVNISTSDSNRKQKAPILNVSEPHKSGTDSLCPPVSSGASTSSNSSMPASRKPSRRSASRPRLAFSSCQQKECMTFDGAGDYAVIGNSMAGNMAWRMGGKNRCSMRRSSSARLAMPNGARVKIALLYWSGSGDVGNSTQVTFRGVNVTATKVFGAKFQNRNYYGAWAEVSNQVQKSGIYKVSNIWYDDKDIFCKSKLSYGAWSMVVIYEHPKVAAARINLCMNDFSFDSSSLSHSNTVGCLMGTIWTTFAKTSVVSFHIGARTEERLLINGEQVGGRLGIDRNSWVPNMNMTRVNVTEVVRNGASYISYSMKGKSGQNGKSRGLGGLVMPLRVVYHTLD